MKLLTAIRSTAFSGQSVRQLKKGFATSASLQNKSEYFSEYYDREFRASIANPEDYWGNIAQNTVWTKRFDKVLDDSNSPFTKWFVGGRLSLCYNAVDRHVDEGNGQRNAIVYDSPITKSKRTITYEELQREVSQLAGALAKLGVTKGDRVLIYMPMISEAVVAMLATIRLGGVHSVVFGGFAPNELAKRIIHCEPKVVISASCGVEPSRLVHYKPMLDEALSLAGVPALPTIVYQRQNVADPAPLSPSLNDHAWQDIVPASAPHDCVDVDANDPLYILYTSGTTGDPKGVQHPTGSHAVVNRWTMGAIYGCSPGDVWWAASDLGWIVGHEYICYSPLLNGNTTVVYEGKPVGTPDAGQFFRVISEHNVRALFTAPTALRAIKREDPDAEEGSKYSLERLKYLFVAGEHCDNETRVWATETFKVPVLDNWWQTETAHAITATCVGLGHHLYPPKDVSGMPVPGFNVQVVNEDGTEVKRGELGRIVCKLPFAPGTMSTLFKADDRFKQIYFSKYPGYYDTMDAGIQDEHGYIKVLARDDDVINVAGHRLSTDALEQVLRMHEDVVDCAVIGVPDDLKGQVPLGMFIQKKGSSACPKQIATDLTQLVRTRMGPVAAYRLSVAVPALPRTRSGKTPRQSLADLAAGKELKIPPTIEDPTVYVPIKAALNTLGFAKGVILPPECYGEKSSSKDLRSQTDSQAICAD